jgi:hypothetical protein
VARRAGGRTRCPPPQKRLRANLSCRAAQSRSRAARLPLASFSGRSGRRHPADPEAAPLEVVGCAAATSLLRNVSHSRLSGIGGGGDDLAAADGAHRCKEGEDLPLLCLCENYCASTLSLSHTRVHAPPSPPHTRAQASAPGRCHPWRERLARAPPRPIRCHDTPAWRERRRRCKDAAGRPWLAEQQQQGGGGRRDAARRGAAAAAGRRALLPLPSCCGAQLAW